METTITIEGEEATMVEVLKGNKTKEKRRQKEEQERGRRKHERRRRERPQRQNPFEEEYVVAYVQKMAEMCE